MLGNYQIIKLFIDDNYQVLSTQLPIYLVTVTRLFTTAVKLIYDVGNCQIIKLFTSDSYQAFSW